MPELGSKGWATVKAIRMNQLDTRFWDEKRDGDFVIRPITGKFTHESDDVYHLFFGDHAKPLGVTGSHPIWSIDRNDWVGATELRIGEKVKTRVGEVILRSKEKVEGKHTVHNLEVYKDHNFLVSTYKVLVHNSCLPGGWIKKDLYSKIAPKKQGNLIKAFEDAMAQGHVAKKGKAGIKKFDGKGKKIGGKWYKYELKTEPSSEFGDHRMYGNEIQWKNPKTGKVETKIEFTLYKSSH